MEQLKNKREFLAEVDEAIRLILAGGQRYRIANRELQRANLYDLRKLRQELMAEIAADEAIPGLLGGAFVAEMEPR